MKLPGSHTISIVAPIVILGVALLILLLTPIPTPNKDVVIAIVSGLLGFLSRSAGKPDDAGDGQ